PTSDAQILGSSTTPAISFIPRSESVRLSVTATNADGCAASGTTAMYVVRPPLGGFNVIPPAVCAGGSATINTYNVVNVTSAWQVIDGDIVSGAGTYAITFRPHAGAANVTVRLTKSGLEGCSITYEQVVPVTYPNVTVTASG